MQRDKLATVATDLKEGGVGSFDLLIEQYGERLYWHIRRIVVQHEEAEDILQDTFVRAYEMREQFRGDTESSLKAWLYKIATTIALKALRRRRHGIFASIDSVRGDLLATYEHEIDPSADEMLVSLQRAILALPTKQRLVFNMRYYDELPFEQISEITGDSVSTLKTNYHYATKRIKEDITTIEL
jgi:RNA polymerase sigma-70 factor (ECF subfamily)